MANTDFTVSIVKSWPEKLDFVSQMAFEQFTNGEKLNSDNLIMDVQAYAVLDVHNPMANNPDYTVIAFKTDCGLYYTGSETVKEMAQKIFDGVAENLPGAKIVSVRTGSKNSKRNPKNTYLTLQLLEVGNGNDEAG